jgi:hypothetical protein
MDGSAGHMRVPLGMIPTLDEQPLEAQDLEEGIVLAQECPIDFQVHHSLGIMQAHGGSDSMQAQYGMQGTMSMMAQPNMVMSYTAPLRPRGMPLPLTLHHAPPMRPQFMGGGALSMACAVPHDIQSANLLVDDVMSNANAFLGMGDDLVRSHSPGLNSNGINAFFVDDPQ